MFDGQFLTAYVKGGSTTVGMDEFIEAYIDEELTVDDSLLGAYNEYLSEDCNNPDDIIYTMDELNDVLCGMDTVDVFYMGVNSNITYGDDYFRFDGYGNIQSLSDWEVNDTMEDDKDFLKKYVLDNELFDEEEAEKIIEECNNLLAQGY